MSESSPSPTLPSTRSLRTAWLLVGIGVVAFAVFHTVIARWKALGLMSEWGFDLTFFHNLVWNVSEGNGYRQSATYHELPGLFAETHFEPILLLAVPFYKVVPRVETLFAVQSTLLALGAIGVYRLARSGSASPLAAALGSWVYLGWWPVWRMAMADVRPLTWALPFLLLCAAALRESRHWEAFTWGVLACLCREEIPILVVLLAGGALLWRLPPKSERRATALSLAVAAGLYFVLTTKLRTNTTFYIRPLDWLQSLFSGSDPDQDMGGWGQTAGDLLGERLRYLRGWLLPVGLGSLAAPELLLATAPLFAYLFSNPQEWASWEGPYIHHTAPAVGIVAAAAALGWTRVAVRLRLHRALVALLLAGLLGAEVLVLTGLKLGPEELIRPHWEIYVQSEISPWLEQEERVTEAHRLAAQVPSDASVMADWHTVHLFSGRSQVYSYHQESPEVILPGPAGLTEPLLVQPGVSPDWALVNLEDPDWAVRVQAAGRLEVDRGGDWILFGPGS